MLFRRIIIRLRITLTILLFLGILAVIGGLFYLNSTGLNDDIREHISSELEDHGIYVEFDSLKYHLTDGLVAKNVQFFDNKSREKKLASLPEVSINLDKTKLLRGIRKINSLSLTNTDIEIPINPEDPNSPRLSIKNINGDIEISNDDSISSTKLTGQYMGVDITLAGNLWQEGNDDDKEERPDDIAEKRAIAYQNFLTYIKRWQWDKSTPPTLNLFIEGDIKSPNKIKLEYKLNAPAVTYQGYALNDINSKGNLTHNLITVDEMEFSNNGKKTSITMDYDFSLRDGRFDIDTNIQVQHFFSACLERELFKGFDITGSSEIRSKGYFKLPDLGTASYFSNMLPAFIQPTPAKIKLEAMGEAKLTSFEYLGTKFDSFCSDFSWNNGDVYLDRLLVKNPTGFLQGRLLYKDKLITYDTETTFSKDTFTPFIKKGGKIDQTLKQIEFTPESTLLFKSTGKINAKDITEWASDGELYLTNIKYQDFNAASLNSKFRWEDSVLNGNLTIHNSSYNDLAVDTLNSKFEWADNTLSGTATVKNSSYKDLTVPTLNSKFQWADNSLNATASLKDTKYKDLAIASLNSKFKWADNALTGNATLKDTKFKEISFKQLDSSISWKDGSLDSKVKLTNPAVKSVEFDSLSASIQYTKKQLLISNILAKHPTGNLSGNFHTADKYFHYDLASTMNPSLYLRFLKNQDLKTYLEQIKFNDDAKYYITAKGQLNKKDNTDFHAEGSGTFNGIAFNGVPLDSVKGDYRLNHAGMLMENTRIVFDYSNYTLHKLFKGQSKGEATVNSCYINNDAKTVTLDGIKTKAFPAPIARMFHEEVAEHLEEYQFYQPPTITASGVFDLIDRPIKDQKLNFKAQLSCPNFNTRYMILDGNLLLRNFSANVDIIKNQVNVKNIRSQIFDDGIAQGNLFFTVPDKGDIYVHGDMNWKNIDFRKVGITYSFDEIPKGRLRGNLQFLGRGDDISSYNTKPKTMGTFALEDGDLVSIPILGPVSSIINPFISPLAGDKALNERLKDVSARFRMVNGVVITDDIQSLTPSLTFFGEGSINLNDDQIDVTIRVNYRGLLGKAMELGGELIKLPVKVLRSVFLNKKPAETGLIQIRGRGHYKDSSWKLVPFDPPRDFNIPLFKPGKAQAIPQAQPVEQ